MILCFGYVCMELLADVPEFPRPGKPAQTGGHREQLGGHAARIASAAARMGALVSLVGTIGSDVSAKSVLNILKREGINPSGLATSEKETGLVQSFRNSGGETLSFASAGANLLTNAAQVSERLLNAKALLVVHGGMSSEENLKILSHATRNGARRLMLASTLPDAQTLSLLDALVMPETQTSSLPCRVFAPKSPVSGSALDIFCGTLAACFQAGVPEHRALLFADTAAQLAVHGNPYPYLGDVEESLRSKA